MVEPYWNPAVENILQGPISNHDKFVIATYLANLMTCTPGWRRVGISHHNQHYRAQLALLQELKGQRGERDAMFLEGMAMLQRGELAIDTDPDYIKGLMTKNLMQYAWYIYNREWTVLANNSMQLFLTSDNPVALDYSGAKDALVHRYLPITPRLCLAVRFDSLPDPAAERLSPQELAAALQRPPRGLISRAICGLDRVRYINRVQVRSAEDLVFSPVASEGIEKLVKKHGAYGVDVRVVQYRDSKDNSIVRGSILSVQAIHK
jgi:hypothetical protein